MRTINKVILIGNITKDPFVKMTAGEKKIATFTVATNRYYKNANGESLSEAEYTNCVAWGPIADQIEQYLVKGKLVYVEGRLKTRIIEKEDATRIYKTEIVVGQLIFLSKREDFENSTPAADIDANTDAEKEVEFDDFSDLDNKF